MTPVRSIISAALKDRAAWDTALSLGFGEHLEDTPRAIWEALGAFYERGATTTAADLDLLAAALKRRYTSPKHATKAEELLRSIASEPVSLENVAEYLRAEKAEREGQALAAAILARRPPEEITGLLDRYTGALAGGEAEGEVSGDYTWREAISSRTSPTGRLKVTPAALNERLNGGLLPGHNVTLFGRPESGKTAAAITLATGFARRGLKVFYAGNEDPIQDLMVRAVSCITGLTLAEMAAGNAEEIEAEAVRRGLGNLIMRQVTPGTLRELEALVRKIRPAVLIVDQLRNISTKADNFTQNLDAIARGIRALGIKYGMVTIAVTQAGDSASGKPILDMGDIDSSNTGIPGAADVLIGVGVTETLERAGLRTLSLPKNKVGGRKDHFNVAIDPTRSRISTPK